MTQELYSSLWKSQTRLFYTVNIMCGNELVDFMS